MLVAALDEMVDGGDAVDEPAVVLSAPLVRVPGSLVAALDDTDNGDGVPESVVAVVVPVEVPVEVAVDVYVVACSNAQTVAFGTELYLAARHEASVLCARQTGSLSNVTPPDGDSTLQSSSALAS